MKQEDFRKISDMPTEVIEKYGPRVPEELVQIWKEYGLGTFLNDYLKIINPDDYKEFVKETYCRGESSLPIFITAFGDIIILEENKYLRLIRYKEGDFVSILENMYYFLEDLEDEELLEDYFEIPLYEEAITRFGSLSYDQCFGFVPLLGLGGKKHVDNLDKVKTREHLQLIVELVGGVF
ncbi:T6SS immunity protein Tdi1 domain-containing protein [Streptococcus entericus]|uniref:T6SS immunity protein Tdi1 domain-containing protein n=1 Tax=Streptococcus entericus TaxID=155680 RepID=UPI0003615AD1|nr:T6SS immunity protein Tdi1 domain-containing protein [Streptococcus entericus]